MRLALKLLLFACLSGCTATQAFIITGESLETVGQQFALTSDAMQAGQASGAISKKQFLEWAEFSNGFDASYWKAVDSWQTARLMKNDIEEKRIEGVIARIINELAGFYDLARKLKLLPAGAP